MKALNWQTTGRKNCHLVLLHGWGLNAQIWRDISARLQAHFTLHLVDLPGFGHSQGYGALSLEATAQTVLRQAPAQAIWLGWSLGGLVASQIALSCPQRVQALITVASSPCFVAHHNWPGIQPQLLHQFQQQLNSNYQQTIEQFLLLQTLGSQNARQDLQALKNAILHQPSPTTETLNAGLEILKNSDLRQLLPQLNLPLLRIYGRLDALVPRHIASLLDNQLPQSPSLIIEKAAHAPFISHPDEFCQAIRYFTDNYC